MSLIPPQLRLYTYGAALAALVAAMLWYHHAIYEGGKAAGDAQVQAQFDAFKSAQAKLATDQLKAQQATLIAYQQQTAEADNEHAKNLATIAALRNTPAPRLRCTTAAAGDSGDAVRAPAASPAGGAAGAGVVPPRGDEGFDPSQAVIAMADRADDVVENCRVALTRWPK